MLAAPEAAGCASGAQATVEMEAEAQGAPIKPLLLEENAWHWVALLRSALWVTRPLMAKAAATAPQRALLEPAELLGLLEGAAR